MNNISDIKNCYGCGVCATACPRNIIQIRLNKKGFYEPYIVDSDRCTQCGLCREVCAYNHYDLALKSSNIHAWASWSNDEEVRKKCSSGGIGFEIGKHLLQEGYQVVGCRYDITHQRAEHYIATTVEELVPSIGSKYIQSYTVDAFKKIDRKKKYLVTGTPCQVDSFRRFIRKFRCEDNFILMDFYCHCVPSMHAWKNYLKILEPVIGQVTYASWRNKFGYGWHDSWLMGMDGNKSSQPVNWHDSYNMLIREKKTFVQSRMSQGDWFYKMFLGHYCLGEQCVKACKYKYDKSSADIRIGDLWGNTYKDDEKGVSALVAFTEKGKLLVENLTNATLIPQTLDIVAEGQMKNNAQPVPVSSLVMFLFEHNIYLNLKQWNVVLSLFGKPFRAYAKLKRIIKGK